MLNRLAIEAALPVALRLEERNLRILPGENTPLLSMALCIENGFVESDLAVNSDVVAVLQERSNTDAHRAAKADIIKLASYSVTRLHDTVKNTVLPHIKRVAGEVDDYVTARRVETVLPYVVVMKEIPAVYSNSAIRQLIKRYPAAEGADFAIRPTAPQADLDAVKGFCKTGMAGVDNELDIVLGAQNDQGYASIQSVLHGQTGPRQIHVDYLPGLLVALQAIYDEPGVGVNLSLNEYNELINGMLGTTAHLANAAWIRYENLEKMGSLYSPEPRKAITDVNVMGKVYRKMLEDGLTPEALIGNEMSGRRFSQQQLIENKAALEQIYNREMNLRNLRAQAEIAGVVREAARLIIGKCIVDAQLEADAAEQAVNTLKELISRISERNCDDINGLVTELICCVFYPETDALAFINMINRVGKSMGDMADPREITLMATIRYVNRWLTRQLGLVEA